MQVLLNYSEREGEVEKQRLRYRQQYKVFLDSHEQGERDVLDAVGIPRVNSFYQSGSYVDVSAICTRVRARHAGGKQRIFWLVDVEYERNIAVGTQNDPDPRNRPAVVYWEVEPGTRAMIEGHLVDPDDGSLDDLGGVVNSAGEPFLDPPEEPYDFRVIVVEKNLQQWDETLARQFDNKTNEIEYLGYPEHTLLCKPATSRTEYAEIPNPSGGNPQTITYYPTRFRFIYNPDTWDKIVPDMGLRALAAGELYDMADKYGNPVTSPVRLDGLGNQLLPSLPYTDTKYRRYRRRDSWIDFHLLALFN